MSNLTKLKFTALNIYENNFLSWILDVEIHLKAMNLRETIKEEKKHILAGSHKSNDFYSPPISIKD